MISLLNRLRTKFLSPDSKLELWLRTVYHKLMATRFVFRLQHRLAKRSYRRWRIQQRTQPLPDSSAFAHQPKVSFILTCPPDRFKEAFTTLESIQNLQGDRWEVLLLTPPHASGINLPPVFTDDARVRLIQAHQGDIIPWISGDYAVFCAAGDQFFKLLLTHFYQSLASGAPAELTYYDCEYSEVGSNEVMPLFKPATPSPALLLSVNILSHGFVRCDALKKLMAKIDPGKDLLAQEYELALRLCEVKSTFRHIPAVLVSQAALVKPNTPEMRRVVMDHLSRQGLEEVSFKERTHGIRFTWNTGSPSVAIIIPSKNNRRFLEPLLGSILDQTNDRSITLSIVDNNSDDPATLAYYQALSREPKVSIIPYHKPFNYSEAINLGVSETDSDLVLLLNDDMKVHDPGWLTELTQWAIRPEVGVVGTKLLRANHTLQHAGIILGLNGFAGHIYLNTPEHYTGLFGAVDWYRQYLAVTGACQMVRREVFNQVGGYDSGFQLAFGDIDFCLRVHQQGFCNIYTPFASTFHLEGTSRGYSTPVGDILKGFTKMEPYLAADDPYFSPNLTYTRLPKCTLNTTSKADRLAQIEARRKFYTDKK